MVEKQPRLTPTVIPSRVVEGQLLQATRNPEALYKVVGWAWSSLVYAAVASETSPDASVNAEEAPAAARPPHPPPIPAHQPSSSTEPSPCEEDGGDSGKLAAPATENAIPRQSFDPSSPHGGTGQWDSTQSGIAWQTAGSSPLRLTTGRGEGSAPFFERTIAGRCASVGAVGGVGCGGSGNVVGGGGLASDGEEAGNASTAAELDATLTAATGTGNSAFTGITTSTATTASSARSPPMAPAVQLSPLTLRLLLWWAGRPVLPSLRAGSNGGGGGIGSACVSRDASGAGRGGESYPQLNRSMNSSESDFVPSRQRQQQEAQEVHQLRLRLADIFTLLCRRGGGVVLSDALLYGRCHDASEAAAARCHLVFEACSDASWHAATMPAAPSPGLGAAAVASTLTGFSSGTFTPPDASAAAPKYSVDRLLSALLELHTTSHAAGDLNTASNGAAAVEVDVMATGQLLRLLLRCPRLHKRIVRLFDSATTKKTKPSKEHLHVMSMPTSLGSLHWRSASGQDRVAGGAVRNTAAPPLHLDVFLPALTSASPIVSAEAWQTLEVLLLPSNSVAASTRQLLLRTPQCPVQRLLAATLALPGEEDTVLHGTPLSTKTGAHAPHWPSHAMARNSALQLLHVLCASTDVPPVIQLPFTQCPALLWRVLRLAGTLCTGAPVASFALVRCVLADYVMAAVSPLSAAVGAVAPPALTPIQSLLRQNGEALLRFFSSTCEPQKASDGSDSTGGHGFAETAADGMCEEEGLQQALQMLQA